MVPAIAYRHAPARPRGQPSPRRCQRHNLEPLTPTGIARVNNETWTAQSLSGPLPAGAPVHVVKVEGLRLFVWSEAGDILGLEALGSTKRRKGGAVIALVV